MALEAGPAGHRDNVSRPRSWRHVSSMSWFAVLLATLVVAGPMVGSARNGETDRVPGKGKQNAAKPSRSTTIALTSDETRLVVVNREANSLSVIRVRRSNGSDIGVKLAEIAVGLEPRCVAVSPDDREAFVTNGISGTVSVVSLKALQLVGTIPVGTEPRGCALTPDGSLLYVANPRRAPSPSSARP